MTATIITIGDEILIGQVLDTNSRYMAKALDKIGIEVREMISIPDDRRHILETFSRLQDKTDFVLITGGLGPTKDDITKKTLAKYFEDELVSARRPKAATRWPNLFLAGDWTATDLPATIEGALRSGETAATLALRHLSL